MITFSAVSVHDILGFRQAMLWPDKPLSHVMLEGDSEALHVGAFDGSQLIGSASFFVSVKRAQMRKFSVSPAFRQRGVGSALLRYAIQNLLEQGVQTIWCDARQSALAFYTNFGFKIDSAIFLKSNVEYQKAELGIYKFDETCP